MQIVIGPRQCGKSSLLWQISPDFNEVSLDDLQMRTLAQQDPALFLTNNPLPLIIDEVQYAPNLFPAIKQHVDQLKKQRIKNPAQHPQVVFRLTGSNQILMDKNIKESLVGRAGFYYLNTFTVSEILAAKIDTSIPEILFKGGWPELYVSNIPPVKYLNDYIRNYIEKDIVLSAGISKQKEFHTVLGLLAARTGQILNYSDIANNSGVKSVTIKEWISLLERSNLLYLLRPYENNLNKRLIKSPKLHFLDTGLACRLQGWTERQPMIQSMQAGHLFETLVLSEIVKHMNNFGKSWELFYWRTKEGEEIDFLIKTTSGEIIALDAKLGIHSVSPINLPFSFLKDFPKIKKIYIVSIGGKRQILSQSCEQIPITELTNFLKDFK
ncbi:MAG: ATP-binding protein [Pseudomonadota bacterium]